MRHVSQIHEDKAMNKISIRFYNNKEVRAIWSDDDSRWYYSATDVVRAINNEADYVKAGNYWRWLKKKLTAQGVQPVSDTHEFKLVGPDGKKRVADVMDDNGVLLLAKYYPNNRANEFLDWFTYSDNTIDGQSKKKAYDLFESGLLNKRYLVTRVGDIIYNPANVVFGAIHRNSLIDGVVSPIYRIFFTDQDSRFMECVVRRPSFIGQLAMKTEGTVTKLKTLKPEAFLDMTVSIPTDLEEQKKIGNYFTTLNRQITLQTQRLEKLKHIKAACLDEMFV